MTIKSPEFDALLREVSSSVDYEGACQKLTQFVDAYVTLRRTQAINAFKHACRVQGLIAVRKDGFEQLVKDLDRLPDSDMAARARQARHDVLDTALPDEDDDKPEFTIKEDEDLDRLLNSTAALLSGRANQDVGMAWYDDLQVVLRCLTTGRQDARRLNWIGRSGGINQSDYAAHVLDRGGDGDLSDIRTFVDKQSK